MEGCTSLKSSREHIVFRTNYSSGGREQHGICTVLKILDAHSMNRVRLKSCRLPHTLILFVVGCMCHMSHIITLHRSMSLTLYKIMNIRC
jgi:hypothetical protein